jgi:hypothetical protein
VSPFLVSILFPTAYILPSIGFSLLLRVFKLEWKSSTKIMNSGDSFSISLLNSFEVSLFAKSLMVDYFPYLSSSSLNNASPNFFLSPDLT